MLQAFFCRREPPFRLRQPTTGIGARSVCAFPWRRAVRARWGPKN